MRHLVSRVLTYQKRDYVIDAIDGIAWKYFTVAHIEKAIRQLPDQAVSRPKNVGVIIRKLRQAGYIAQKTLQFVPSTGGFVKAYRKNLWPPPDRHKPKGDEKLRPNP